MTPCLHVGNCARSLRRSPGQQDAPDKQDAPLSPSVFHELWLRGCRSQISVTSPFLCRLTADPPASDCFDDLRLDQLEMLQSVFSDVGVRVQAWRLRAPAASQGIKAQWAFHLEIMDGRVGCLFFWKTSFRSDTQGKWIIWRGVLTKFGAGRHLSP